jgi:hypothetical protein
LSGLALAQPNLRRIPELPTNCTVPSSLIVTTPIGCCRTEQYLWVTEILGDAAGLPIFPQLMYYSGCDNQSKADDHYAKK